MRTDCLLQQSNAWMLSCSLHVAHSPLILPDRRLQRANQRLLLALRGISLLIHGPYRHLQQRPDSKRQPSMSAL